MEGLSYIPEDMVVSFTDVTIIIYNTVTEMVQEVQPEVDEAEGRFFIPFFSSGGCNDAFSGFGFLAFLLALLDLILELGNDNGMRKRRETNRYEESSQSKLFITNTLRSNAEIEEASSACYSMYRGFLNALATLEGVCAKRFLCEGAKEAASQGRLGQLIATVGSENAATWLLHENRTKYKDVVEGGLLGAGGGPCGIAFSQCFSLPSIYRYPRVHSTDADEDPFFL